MKIRASTTQPGGLTRVAAMLTVVVLGVVCQSARAAFNLLRPPNCPASNKAPSVSVTFEWESQAGATSYRIECDDNSDFSSPVFTWNTPNTSYQPPCGFLEPGTIYYWRVTATLSDGTQVLGTPSPASFTTRAHKGQISRNFYRLPYANGTHVGGRDYLTHSPAGHMDMRAQDEPATVVAMADGWVLWRKNECDDCGPYGPAGNGVVLVHANGEYSDYDHLRYHSIPAGIQCGVWVHAGDMLGIEGDVGHTEGNDGPPRGGTCETRAGPCCINGLCSKLTPADCSAAGGTYTGPGDCNSNSCDEVGGCFRHCHCTVVRDATVQALDPIFWDVPDNLFVDPGGGYRYTAGQIQACQANVTMSGVTDCGFGHFKVIQASGVITASNYALHHLASHVFHAGQKVRLLPGFHAEADSYFRAEIGPCDQTAGSHAPPPISPLMSFGACYTDDGACSIQMACDCRATPGSTFQGDNTNCTPPGACCTGCRNCSTRTQRDCRASGGTYQGDNTSCSGGTCN